MLLLQLSKLYKLSEEPERKEFLDKLVSFMEQQGKRRHSIGNRKWVHFSWKL